MKSFGSAIRLGSFILLLGLIPYTLFAGFRLYLAISSWATDSTGTIVYSIARVIACVILIYALWQLRKTGLRVRKDNSRGK